MKALVTTLGLFFVMAFAVVNAQVFHVVKVQGNITNLNTGKPIKAGDMVQAKDRIAFESVSASMVAIDDNRSKFLIKMPKTDNVDKTSLIVLVSQATMAVKSRNAFKTRAFNPEQKEVVDLKQYFGSDRFSIIGNQVNVTLSEQMYPLSPDQFIVFHYNIKDKPVSKKLGFDQQTIKIEADKLKEVKGETITTDEIEGVMVYQYEMPSKNYREITSFNLLFVDGAALTAEFNTIIPILRTQKMDDKGIKEYLVDYYVDFYGVTDSKALSAFIDVVLSKKA
ncbi:hypothetical protein [Williamwhitmania taraxaci]|uniref:Uncharacterized protein n=1 Tax=Williamwhitmania taraxaci TaxID=1640674 RepID=A0A1G6QYM6_9BACT|nr:hypothetical protein [Williamwhitmania taraxaci]SDC97432.1 hypothetical protein SAMN05216323_106716 [Williamwhitmania taraxaci]